MDKEKEIFGAPFSGFYDYDDFGEIPNPKTVHKFENGIFVETENTVSYYGFRTDTLADLEARWGKYIGSKEFTSNLGARVFSIAPGVEVLVIQPVKG